MQFKNIYHDTTIASVLGGYYLECAVGGKPTSSYKTTLRDSVREGLISTATQELDYYLQLNSEYIFSYGSHSKSKPVSELLLILH